MPRVLQTEISKLKKLILALGASVENNMREAVRAVKERNVELARQVIASDDEIDQMEIDVEEEGLKILALHQPVAIDLRFIVSVLKINNDLERIGDLAVNIAERVILLEGCEDIDTRYDMTEIALKTQSMLKRCLDALVNLDADLAVSVCADDDEIDELNRRNYLKVAEDLAQGVADPMSRVTILGVSRDLERVADHATNIAQDVVYMLEGRIIRHRDTSGSSE
jgi:phosphate transport system protein